MVAELPRANTVIDDEAGGFAGLSNYVVVAGCVAQNADSIPRVFAGVSGILDLHGYAPAVDYSAIHIEETGLPVIFVPMPIATPGVVGSEDDTGVTGTSVVTAAAGGSGALEQVEGVFTVTVGGTVGTDELVGTLSLDGGRTSKTVRLGTANSYVIPNIGVTLAFAAGTLLAGDVFTFRTTAPMWDGTGILDARQNLALQSLLTRKWLVVGDAATDTVASLVVTQVNAYETANDRFTTARVSIKDRLPLPKKSKVGGETLTFNTTGDTITRSAGSWLDDGFAVGDTVSIDGTVSNDGASYPITTLTATVLTTSVNLVNETVDSEDVDIVKVQTKAAWISAANAEFGAIASERRINISAGRARKQSPILGALLRRPASWAASVREYQHDLHIPAWRKADGPLSGWSLEDANGLVSEEFDERTDGGALAAGFTCFRTWANGPRGTFLALDLTRAAPDSVTSRDHNMNVANLAQSIVQAEAENALGQVLELDTQGRPTAASRQRIEQRVNTKLDTELLANGPEGPRASFARWTMSATDVLNTPGAESNGFLDLGVNGTLERINTRIRVR